MAPPLLKPRRPSIGMKVTMLPEGIEAEVSHYDGGDGSIVLETPDGKRWNKYDEEVTWVGPHAYDTLDHHFGWVARDGTYIGCSGYSHDSTASCYFKGGEFDADRAGWVKIASMIFPGMKDDYRYIKPNRLQWRTLEKWAEAGDDEEERERRRRKLNELHKRLADKPGYGSDW